MSDHASHGVNDLVISCMDFRFRERVARWIAENLNNQADLVGAAGASKAILDPVSREFLMNMIKIGRDLHGVKTVHVIDHIDCGAYGGSKQHADEPAETDFHAAQLKEAAKLVAEKFPSLVVNTYLMGWEEVKTI